jgi:hypothetical protein
MQTLKSAHGNAVLSLLCPLLVFSQSNSSFLDCFALTRNWDNHSLNVGQAQDELDKFCNEKKREMNNAVRDFNVGHMAESNEFARTTRAKEDQDNLEEVNNNLNSVFLNEDRSAERSMLGSNRKLPYNYKGMTQGQRSDVFAENERQRQEMETNRAVAKANKDREEAEAERTRNLLLAQERAIERQQREKRVATATTHLQQADTARNTTRQFNASQITTHDQPFYSQFGTSSR